MNRNTENELLELLSELCEQELSQERQQQLNSLLRESSECREVYLAYLDIHASFLSNATPHLFNLGIQDDSVNAAEDKLSIFPSPNLGFLAPCRQQLSYHSSNPVSLSIASSAFIISCILFTMALIYPKFSADKSDDLASRNPKSVPVARIYESINCTWVENDKDLKAGDVFYSGRTIQLLKGRAEIQYLSGATVIMQGPPILGLESENASRLEEGILAAFVPKRAKGFTVQTPYADIVDLGTRFVVSVDEQQGTFTYVKKGKVEVQYTDPGSTKRSTKLLKVGDAFRVHPTSKTFSDVASIQKLEKKIRLSIGRRRDLHYHRRRLVIFSQRDRFVF